MNTLLVTSTEDGIGKTAIGLALARHAQDRGQTVAYMKPKGTRLRSATGKTRDEDPMLARELLGLDAAMHEMEPVVYSPTFVQDALRGREDPDALQERIADCFDALSADADLVVVEGSGSQTLGSVVDLTDRDVAALLDARALVVAPYAAGEDVDPALAAAEGYDRLAGVLFNGVRDAALDELQESVVPFLRGRDVPVVGELPRDQSLAGASVADLADELGADLLTSEDVPTDAHVERFVVAAMSADSALDQFRRTREAVLVAGGDRPEIHAAALEAGGIEALVLTGGLRPPGAVLGRAEEAGVPVLSVQSDTRATIDRVEETLASGRTRTAAAVERMADLLAERAALDALLD
ncbi:MAG: phosphotransacetylase family protein [Halobacteriaceae archaeon]